MPQLTRLLLLALTALALAAAGCGDDDEATTDEGATGATGVSGAPLTKEEFISQADEICADSGRDIDQEANALFSGGQPSQEEIDQFADDVLVPGLQEQADAIRALTPPEGDEEEIGTMLDRLEQAIDEIEQDPSLLQASDDAGPFTEVNQLAQDYGLKECGSG